MSDSFEQNSIENSGIIPNTIPRLDYQIPKQEEILVVGAGNSVKEYWDEIISLSQEHYTIISNPNPALDALVQNANCYLFLDNPMFHERKNVCKGLTIISQKVDWKDEEQEVKDQLIFLSYNAYNRKAKKIEIDKYGHIKTIVGNAGFASILCATYFRPKRIYIQGFDGPSKVNKDKLMFHYYEEKPRFMPIKPPKIKRCQNHLYKIFAYIVDLGIEIYTFTPIMWEKDYSEFCTQIHLPKNQ